MPHCLLFMVYQFPSILCFSDLAFGSFCCINILNFYVIKPINLLLYVLYLYFCAWKCFPYSERDIYLVQHGKHCFRTVAIFSGSILEGVVSGQGEGGWEVGVAGEPRVGRRVGEEEWGCWGAELLRLSLLIMLRRLFLFPLRRSSKDWWEEGRANQRTLNDCPLGGLGGWAASVTVVASGNPFGCHSSQGAEGLCCPLCFLLIWLGMGGSSRGER